MSEKLCPKCKKNWDGLECPHTTHDILCECVRRLDELERKQEALSLKGYEDVPTSEDLKAEPPPPTELEKLRADLERWKKYFPSERSSTLWTKYGIWCYGSNTFYLHNEQDCQIVLDLILADQLRWAYEHGSWLQTADEHSFSFAGLPTFHPTILDALFALRKKLEKKP